MYVQYRVVQYKSAQCKVFVGGVLKWGIKIYSNLQHRVISFAGFDE